MQSFPKISRPAIGRDAPTNMLWRCMDFKHYLTELEMKQSGGKLMDTSFESIDSTGTMADHEKFSDLESTISESSLNVSMESLHSVGTPSGFGGAPTMGFCTTDTEKELEQTKRRELCLEGELLKQKDDNYRLRQKVAALESQIHSYDDDPNSSSDLGPSTEFHTNLAVSSSSDSQLTFTRNAPNRASLVVRDRRITTLERQIEFLKNQVATKTEKLVCAEMRLKDVEWGQERGNGDELRKNKDEVARLTGQLATMSKMAVKVNEEFKALKEAYNLLRLQVQAIPTLVNSETVGVWSQIENSLMIVGDRNSDILQRYLREMKLRKKYHNDLVELRGNIRVFCRVRPRIKEDGNDKNEIVVSKDCEDDGLVKVNNIKGRGQHFDLDKVFGVDSTQSQLFSEVAALVRSVMDGYNVCIFAYGQTGSGKTYTMEGPLADPGINQRALRLLFDETRDINWTYEINASVLEIYNETIKDLLNPDPNNKLEVKMKTEGGYHVPGLSTMAVNCVQDVNRVFEIGRRNRAVASTNLNEHSSRSHCLLCVTVKGTNATTGLVSLGRLNLVDLAGSERLSKSHASGARLKEAQNINRSLACLGDVIHALRNKHNHVPYRNSKLTYLLQDSLGGDSKTLMIVQVSPVEKNLPETLCSLSFAQRVKTVELGQANRLLESGAPKAQTKSKGPTQKRPANLQIHSETPLPRSPSASPLTASPVTLSPRHSPKESPLSSPRHSSNLPRPTSPSLRTHQTQLKSPACSSTTKSSPNLPQSTGILPPNTRPKSWTASFRKKSVLSSKGNDTRASSVSSETPHDLSPGQKPPSLFSFRRTRPSK